MQPLCTFAQVIDKAFDEKEDDEKWKKAETKKGKSKEKKSKNIETQKNFEGNNQFGAQQEDVEEIVLPQEDTEGIVFVKRIAGDEWIERGAFGQDFGRLISKPKIQTPPAKLCEPRSFMRKEDTKKDPGSFQGIEESIPVLSNGSLKTFRTIIPEGMNAISAKGEWEAIEFAVDSGATETVITEDMLPGVELKDGWASKNNVEYEVANGDRIPNMGGRML